MVELCDWIITGIFSLFWMLLKATVLFTVVSCIILRAFGGLSKNEVLDDLPFLTAAWWNKGGD